MKLVWTPRALRQRAEVFDYIATDNPVAAVRMDRLFGTQADKLTVNPRIGRPGAMVGSRELFPHKSYRLVYDIDGDVISILTIISTARQWPPAQS